MNQKKIFTTLAATALMQLTLLADGSLPPLPDADQLIAANAVLQGTDVTASTFKGVYITSKKDDILKKGRPSVSGVQFEEFEYPQDEAQIRTLLQPYFGKELSAQQLENVRAALVDYFSKAHPTAHVIFPEQNAVNGVVQILISHHVLGEIRYTGNEWYSNAYLSRYVHINSGEEISDDVLLNDFSWLSRNPFQKVTPKYIPSTTPGVMDIELTVKDRLPVRFYTRAENSGNASTGNVKFAGGFTWGNAFWIGDTLTYEYGTSNLQKRVFVNRLNYNSFLPWRHIFGVSGNYNVTKPKVIKAKTRSVNYGTKIRYTVPFRPWYTPLSQDLTWGFDWKHFTSQTFSKTTRKTKHKTLNETLLYLAYTVSDVIGKHMFNLSFENYYSPGEMIDKQKNKDFKKYRKGSKNDFWYGILTAGYTYTMPMDFSLALLGRTQRASRTLPPSDQFGVGGYSSVRGYKESIKSGDNGVVLNLELRSPPIKTSTKLEDKLIFLGFVDYGFVNSYKLQKRASPTSPKNHVNAHLWGAGAGVRYNINPYIAFRGDYGFKLKDLYFTNKTERRSVSGFGRWHLGLLASY